MGAWSYLWFSIRQKHTTKMASTTTPKNTLLGATNYEPRLRSHLKPQRFKLVEQTLRLDSALSQMNPLTTRLDLRDPNRFGTTANDIGKMATEHPEESKFAPQNVLKVLRFQSFYVENVDESNLEVVRLRRNTILLYLHDETFEIIEPRVSNSGIPQGTFLKRCQLRRPDGELYSSADLRIGVDLHIFGRSFKLYDCDEFTREYYAQRGEDVGSPLPVPKDEYTLTRDQITRMCGGDHEHFYGKQRYPLKTYMEASLGNPIRSRLQSEKKRKFLANNRKVLCFHCEYDVRDQLYGDLMLYILDYFLEDDTIEFKEVSRPNNGRDPFPLLLRRGRLLKNWRENLRDEQDRGVEEPTSAESYYSEPDLYVGAVLNVFGRNMVLVDADKYTRDYYQMAWGRVLAPSIPTKVEKPVFPKAEPAPYNGYGTEEDSLGSCNSLCPKPPRKDFNKMAEFDRMLLRFRGRLIANRKEQQQRRFIVTYFLTDDTVSVYEPEMRNSGIVNGKFLERGTYKSPEGMRYILEHFVVGAELVLSSHRFQLIDADEYTKKILAS
ncbi:hypothetical protein BBO99_00003689 [Phytophthora kernoviae]|uniref:DM10 domain-containing protein n=2 Tax=Phytophthora kernoviae TaxID=325452 RepID=A0A3R7KVL0_9STRA|nr:hypothetical protein G195_005217 [Phytophthora kernoviae 00238/432]KAG2523884.1 hypothetical protein JM16_003194 [Phytophthora kernoviae]KAG2525679.1 hypothetical protein JM18_003064 [Phytophthora kernoviae]RLN02598.1 hypothetical protein BBI17_003413 [Phytophthora kernoviae]RLN81463.1 hypothetical protein BBO99_00003689 [Phytophthora kernoviae]